MIRINHLTHGIIDIPHFELEPGETGCILGGNASGKSLLAGLIAGEIKPEAGSIERLFAKVALLSFETLQSEYERELANDDTDFMDRIDFGSTGLELLLRSGCGHLEATEAAARHGIRHLLDRGCRQFSTGELRRVYLLQAALQKPELLILDEPYEGLDVSSAADLDKMIAALVGNGCQVLLFANRISDVSCYCTHVSVLNQGQLILKAKRDAALADPSLQQLFTLATPPVNLPASPKASPDWLDPLFSLRNASIRYGDTYQFKNLTWKLHPKQHTLITGPNGCGKSSLLSLLTGDHPQCYQNDIEIFGYQRGSGESIWDIKRHIGYLSPSLHRDYRASCSVEAALVSGFHDSIGLYQTMTTEEKGVARQWLELFSLSELSTRPFRSLSYGQQRLVLVARALIKQPPLLILDEPTQGLDDMNRHLVLACVQRLAALPNTTILFVSHRSDEHLPLFQTRLHFEKSKNEDTRFQIIVNP